MATKVTTRGSGNKTHCVAIDMGASSVRAIEMEWNPSARGDEQLRTLRHGSAAMPPHVWNDLSAHREVVLGAIKGALAAGGIVAKSAVVCVPRRLVTLRFVRLPHAPPEQMRSMVAFEAQQYILFSLDEVLLDYYVLPEPLLELGTGEDMETVLLAAVRRSLIAEMMAIFDRAGLEIERLTISALALAEHLRGAGEASALIDIEPGEMDVAVVSEGRLLFTRATALDVEGVLPEVAERRLAEEIARSFTAYQNEFRQRPLAHIYLAGASANGMDGETIARSLSAMLEMPVEFWDSRLLPVNDTAMRAYATAIGTALQNTDRSIAPINLVPDERAARKAQQTRRQRSAFALVATVAIIIVSALFAQKQLVQQNALRKKTLEANAALDEVSAQLQDRQSKYERRKALETEVSTGLNRVQPVVDVLTAVSRSLPKSAAIWLTQFAYEREGTLTLRGETKNPSAATDLVLALQRSGAFTQVRLNYLGDAQEQTTSSSNTTVAQNPQSPPITSNPPVTSNPGGANITPLPGMGGTPGFPGGGGQPSPGGAPGGMPGGGFPGGPPAGSMPSNAFPPGGFRPGGGGAMTFTPDGSVFPGGGATLPLTPPVPVTGEQIIIRPMSFQVQSPISPSQQPKTPAAQTRKKSQPSVLTSFVITCRVNPGAKNLLPANNEKKPLETALLLPQDGAQRGWGERERERRSR